MVKYKGSHHILVRSKRYGSNCETYQSELKPVGFSIYHKVTPKLNGKGLLITITRGKVHE